MRLEDFKDYRFNLPTQSKSFDILESVDAKYTYFAKVNVDKLNTAMDSLQEDLYAAAHRKHVKVGKIMSCEKIIYCSARTAYDCMRNTGRKVTIHETVEVPVEYEKHEQIFDGSTMISDKVVYTYTETEYKSVPKEIDYLVHEKGTYDWDSGRNESLRKGSFDNISVKNVDLNIKNILDGWSIKGEGDIKNAKVDDFYVNPMIWIKGNGFFAVKIISTGEFFFNAEYDSAYESREISKAIANSREPLAYHNKLRKVSRGFMGITILFCLAIFISYIVPIVAVGARGILEFFGCLIEVIIDCAITGIILIPAIVFVFRSEVLYKEKLDLKNMDKVKKYQTMEKDKSKLISIIFLGVALVITIAIWQGMLFAEPLLPKIISGGSGYSMREIWLYDIFK